MKRDKIELLPTLRTTMPDDGDDNSVVVEDDIQLTVVSVRNIATSYGEKVIAGLENESLGRVQMFLNSYSINNLIEAFGSDDDFWKGKIVTIKKEKDKKFKKLMLVCYPLEAEKV